MAWVPPGGGGYEGNSSPALQLCMGIFRGLVVVLSLAPETDGKRLIRIESGTWRRSFPCCWCRLRACRWGAQVKPAPEPGAARKSPYEAKCRGANYPRWEWASGVPLTGGGHNGCDRLLDDDLDGQLDAGLDDVVMVAFLGGATTSRRCAARAAASGRRVRQVRTDRAAGARGIRG